MSRNDRGSQTGLAGAGSERARAGGRRGSGTFAALGERDYSWYFVGNIAFFMGMQMQMLLRGFLAFDLTNAAAALGYMSASIAIPMLLVAPVGGVVADRVNKRTLLIVTQTTAAATALFMAVLILGGWIQFWHLLVMSVVTGVVFSFNMPARQALVPQLVPQHKLMNAISLQMGGMNATRIVAPATAGLLIAPLGVGWVYMLTFSLFVVAVASEFHLPVHGMVSQRKRVSFREDFVEGFRYIRAHRTIALLLLLGLAFPLFGFPVQQMLPVFADNVFNKGAGGLGLLAASTGVGGLIGALVAANLDRYRHKGRLMLLGGLWMGGLFIAFTQAPSFVPALFFLALGNIGGMIFQTTNNTVIQANLPAEMRGRVMSVMMMSFGLMPLGVLPVSLAADAVGAPTAVAASSTLMIIALLAFFLLSKRVRTLTLDQFSRAELSPVQAAGLVAAGKLTAEEAERRTRGAGAPVEGGEEVAAMSGGAQGAAAGPDDIPPDLAPSPLAAERIEPVSPVPDEPALRAPASR